MCTHFRGFDDVHRVADGGDEDLGIVFGVVIVDCADIGDEVEALLAYVIEAANEWRDERCASLGGK